MESHFNKEELEALLIDYIDGNLDSADQIRIERLITQDVNVATLHRQLKEVIEVMSSSVNLEPSENMKNSFQTELDHQIRQNAKGKVVSMQQIMYKVAAAAAFVILGVAAGFWISDRKQQAAELAAVKEEMMRTRKLMMSLIDNQASASQRLKGVTVAYNDIATVDEEIVNALIKAMNEDENTNVRIAALEALGKLSSEPKVKMALIASLETQKDPLVQIALIRMMVEMKPQGVKEELERITTDDEALPAVKDEAHAGLLKLS